MKLFYQISLVLSALFCLSHTTQAQPGSVTYRGKTFYLSWWDEFSGPRVDSTRWDFRRDSKNFSTQLARNNVQENGILKQYLRKETANGKSYTAGGVISEDTLHYGYYEASFKTPPRKGWHSGFWLMKQDGTGGTGVARASLEIDILENESENLNSFTCLHRKYNPINNFGTKTYNTAQLSQRFVKVGCLYEADSIIYFYDGKQVDKRYVGNLTTGKMNIWLTSIGYQMPLYEPGLPYTFEVDYIRFYELNPPTKNPVTLSAMADAIVKNGVSASQNFGSQIVTGTVRNSSGNEAETYLRFDLSSFKYYVGSAKLRLYVPAFLGSGPAPKILVKGIIPSSSWTESGLTWNNRPTATETDITTLTLDQGSGRYYEFDISPWVIARKEAAMNNLMEIKLVQLSGTDQEVQFNSREAGSNPPQLLVKPIEMVPVLERNLTDTVWMKDSALAYSLGVRSIKPLSFQWRKNGVIIPGATTSTLNFTSLQPADSGNYSVKIWYTGLTDTVESRIGQIRVRSSNIKPTATLLSPASGSTYAMGQVISLSGSASDPETGTLKGPDLRWFYRYYRNGSLVTTAQIGSGLNVNWTVPNTSETGTNVNYRIYLVARDPQGGRDTVWVPIQPRLRNITLQTLPSGLSVVANSQTVASGQQVPFIEGYRLPLDVLDPQSDHIFQSWSVGGTQQQTFTVPASDLTITCQFVPGRIVIRNPSMDAYVLNTSANSNFGTATTVGARYNSRESVFRFDLQNLQGTLLNARLRLFGGLSDANTPNVHTNISGLPDSVTFTETSITWNSRPNNKGTFLATQDVVGMTKRWYEYLLTSYIEGRLAANQTLANLHLGSPYETASRVDFNSKEATTEKPELRLALAYTAPTLSSQPQAASICEGAQVSFSSTAAGFPVATVQWQVSTDNGTTWNPIPSATSSTYSFSPTLSQSGHRFRAVWTNQVGNASSQGAVLTVRAKPTASISSPDLSVCSGQAIILNSNQTIGNRWSTGDTTQSITVFSPDQVSLLVVQNGCGSDVETVTPQFNPLPEVFSLSSNSPYCLGIDSGALVSLSSSQTGVRYDLAFSGGNSQTWFGTGNPLSGLVKGAGTVSISATDTASGCTSVMNGSISIASQLPQIWYRDFDNDGYGDQANSQLACSQPSGFIAVAGDCNDSTSGLPCYCIPAAMDCSGTYFTQVQINTLNRASGCQVDGYALFPAISNQTTSMQRGLSYPLQLQTNLAGNEAGFGIWCDFNEDNDFSDPGEFLFGTSGLVSSFSGNILIPQEASTGFKRLRIRAIRNQILADSQSCSFFPEGVTEDYTIEIIQPIIRITSVVPTSMCSGSDMTVSFTTDGTLLAGNTFQVQISGPGGSFKTGASIIGTGSGSPIACHVSLGTVEGNYRFRVVASTPLPATFGVETDLVYVRPKPAFPTSSTVSRCGPGSVTLLANGCSEMKWFDAVLRGNELGTGTSFTTPSLSATRTYYVACVDANGCQSMRRASTALINPLPTISLFAPASGNVNQTTVVIAGTGFSTLDSVVFSGGKRAQVLSSAASSIQVRVPIGAVSGPIRVFTKCGMVVSSASFTAVTPVIANPTFSPAGGTYNSAQSVSLATATSGASIYYTLDGTTPNPASPLTKLYNGTPIFVGSSLTIKAMGYFQGWTSSGVSTAVYTISTPTIVATPVISPASGSYVGGQVLQITCGTPQATIWYTLNGQVPQPGLNNPIRYVGPVTLISPNVTVRAIAVREGWTNSAVAVSNLTISGAQSLSACSFTPPAGTYGSSQVVSITNPDSQAQIFYTLDGTDPYRYMPLARPYAGPLAISKTTTIKAQAFRNGFGDSPRLTGVFTIQASRMATEPDEKGFAKLEVYPNPSNGNMELLMPDGWEESEIQMLDALGRIQEVKTQKVGHQKVQLIVSNPVVGVYFLQLRTATGEMQSRRVLIR